MGHSSPKWIYEKVPDHKFDYVDVKEYRSSRITTKLHYAAFHMVVLKSSMVLVFDLYTAGSLLAFNHWSMIVPAVPLSIARWIFAGSILLSLLLLLWEAKKAIAVLKSRDISFTFTNTFAYRLMALHSYCHFCFFREITKSNRCAESTAFFVHFVLRGWKRLLLAEGPRQVINTLTIKSAVERYLAARGKSSIVELVIDFLKLQSIPQDQQASFMNLVLLSMAITIFWFAVSLIQLCVAAICYLPLLCHIQGNLKEFCCHLIDKRISDLLRRQRSHLDGNEHLRLTYLEKAAYNQPSSFEKKDQIGKGVEKAASSPISAGEKLRPLVRWGTSQLPEQVGRPHRDWSNSRWQLPSLQTQKAALQDWKTSCRPQTAKVTATAQIVDPAFTKQFEGTRPRSKHMSSLSDPFRHIPGRCIDRGNDISMSNSIISPTSLSESVMSGITTLTVRDSLAQKHQQHRNPPKARPAVRMYSISSETTLTSQYRSSNSMAGASRLHSLAASNNKFRFQQNAISLHSET